LQNLQYFFPANTSLDSPKTTRLLQGELTLFKRPKSHQWQCRFKLPNGEWHAASTATEDLDAAQTQAISIYETVKITIGAGLAVTSKTFKQVAVDEIANMAQATDNKTGKRTYRDYTFATNKYLIPFFGQYEISQITNELLMDFESWRIAEMGRIPMASTKRNHASAYIRVINLARDRGI
jgi:integrase